MDGFEDYWTTLMTLLGMIRGTFNFFPLLAMDTIFTHCLFYSFYIFTYGLTIALIIAVLNDSYKTVKSQMFYKSTLDLQDYEMIDFMMKRFKLWAGFEKPKEVRSVTIFWILSLHIIIVVHNTYYPTQLLTEDQKSTFWRAALSIRQMFD